MNYGSHSVNLAIRFILEMSTLFMVAYWGWTVYSDWPRYLATIGLPILLAGIWGIFAVPNDPSRSGKTVVVTQGWIRLVIEFAFFGYGAWVFYNVGFHKIAFLYALLVVVHYATSMDRLKWLLKQ